MKLRVWGARGSTPVSGPEYLVFGGDTTCLEVRTATGEVIILDAGTGIRGLGKQLLEDGIHDYHMLLTHAHWDHQLGFPFFKPLYRSDCTMDIRGCVSAQESVEYLLSQAMRAPFFPVHLEDVGASLHFEHTCPNQFGMAGLEVRCFPMSHPNGGCGFLMIEGDKKAAFFPDNEPLFPHEGAPPYKDFVEFIRGVDVLFHDGEYLREEYEVFSRGWGHNVFEDTVKLAIEAGAKRLVLWHLNQDRDDDGLFHMQDQARALVRHLGADLECHVARTGLTIEI
jgi:phosphoribosyl 1,2-cyclic phosphodiesterase